MNPPAPPRRRVLMTADAVGGVWTYALTLAAGLRRRGTATTLAVMGPCPSPAQRRAALAIQDLVLDEADYRLEWMEDAGPDVDRAAAWLLDLERRHTPDVVHLNGYAHAALPWTAPCLVAAHSCVASWWAATKKTPLPGVWRDYVARVRRGLMAADMVVAPSFAFMAELQRHYGRRERIVVIHNGRDPSGNAPALKQALILAAGRLWDEAKNIRILDEIAPCLDWPVQVAGDARPPGGGTTAWNTLHSLGPLAPQDVSAAMERAAIFVSPARYEPFGLAVLEAALAGCALVLGDIPAFRELWDGSALFVDPDDAAALLSALQTLCRNDDLRATLGRRAWARAGRYSTSRMVDAYVAAYDDLLYRADFAAITREPSEALPG